MLLPKTSLLSKFPCLLSPPPTDLEWFASFLDLSLLSVYGSQFLIIPRKLPRKLQAYNWQVKQDTEETGFEKEASTGEILSWPSVSVWGWVACQVRCLGTAIWVWGCLKNAGWHLGFEKLHIAHYTKEAERRALQWAGLHCGPCLVAQSCPTLCDPMAHSPSGSSVHGILQATILEWLPCPSPGNHPNPGIEPRSPSLQAVSLPTEPAGNPKSESVAQSCLTLCKSTDCSSPGSSGILHAGDLGSIPRSGRTPGEGNGNPLQYSCLENPMTEEPHSLQSMGSQELDMT